VFRDQKQEVDSNNYWRRSNELLC